MPADASRFIVSLSSPALEGNVDFWQSSLAAETTEVGASKFWTTSEFNGTRVYQRNDLIDTALVVVRPFVLDFAGAYLDTPPDFPEETWIEWEPEKREQFDVRWPIVQAILGPLEALDIHMVDVSPSNIAFLD